MTRENNPAWHRAAPRWILAAAGVYLLVDLLAAYLWSAASGAFSIQAASDGSWALSVTAMAAVGFWLCWQVLRSFPSGAPLRPAWMLLTLAVASQAISGVVAQVLGSDWVLNPFLWTGFAKPGLTAQIRLAALIADGPVRLALLAAALLAALGILRKYGFWGRPRAADWALCGIVALFALCRIAEAGAASLAGAPLRAEDWSSLAGLPLLCVLFLEAILLRQAALRMGDGPLARCWSALMWGVFLSGFAELLLWLTPHYARAPLAMVESLAGFLTTAVFALVPAYQLAAQRMAVKPSGGIPQELATSVPAIAR